MRTISCACSSAPATPSADLPRVDLSCPRLSRASTSYLSAGPKTWMAGTSPAMTRRKCGSSQLLPFRRLHRALAQNLGRRRRCHELHERARRVRLLGDVEQADGEV